MRRPSEHLRPASSLKPSPTLTEPRPGDLWPGRDCRREFRQARSRTPLPDSVLAEDGMTDGGRRAQARGGSRHRHRRQAQAQAVAAGADRNGQAGRHKCGSSCRGRQEIASGDRRGSAARLSDGSRRWRKMVARDEQKQTRGRAAWGDALGVVARAMATSRRKDRR